MLVYKESAAGPLYETSITLVANQDKVQETKDTSELRHQNLF